MNDSTDVNLLNELSRRKRIRLKWIVKIERFTKLKLIERTVKTEDEIKVAKIFRKLARNPKSELLISPIKGKFYLKSPDKRVLVTLQGIYVSVINHKLGYPNVVVSRKTRDSLKRVFISNVEKRREQMEGEFDKNIEQSLDSINQSVNIE